MSSDPPPIAALQSANPLLDHVLRRCLEKDPERRWQSIGDVAGELRWIADHPAPPSAVVPHRRSSRLPWLLTIVALGIAAAALIPAVRQRRSVSAIDSPVLRFEVSTPPSDDPSVALSPDGTLLAFIANRDHVPMLWVRTLNALENRAIAGTDGASFPFWSPDGREVAFFADDKLKRVDLAGGTPRDVVGAPNARGGTWNSDGVMLFAAGVSGPIMRVSARGGAAESVTQVNGAAGAAHRLP